MNKLANLALGGILTASLAMSGCMIYVTEQVRPRAIHHEYSRHRTPRIIICYEWPGRDHYCNHGSCYDRYIVELRHKYDQSNVRPFEYSLQRQAFPHEAKVERRGSVRTKEKVEEKIKESRRAFPKPETPKKHFSKTDSNSGS